MITTPSPMLNNLLGKSKDDVEEKAERRTDPWFAYRNRPVSARMIRRARRAEMVRTTKRYHAKRNLAEMDFNRISEAEAVRRLREWEVNFGFAPIPVLINMGLVDRKTTSIDSMKAADLLGLLEEKDEVTEAAR